MDSRLLDMLHDTGNEDVLVLVGQRIDIDLDGVAQVGIDQHRRVARNFHGFARITFEARTVIDDLHRTAAQNVGRANDDGVADPFGDGDCLLLRSRRAVVGLAKLQLMDQLLEAVAVLGQVDGVGRCTENGDARGLERLGELERRLPTELHDKAQQLAIAALDLDQFDDILGRQRLEVETVGGVVVGRHCFRVAVDHDGLIAGIAQRVDGVDAAIVELDALADAIRSAAQDDDLAAIGRLGFALRRIDAIAFVAGVEIGRVRLELGGAGIDALEDGTYAQAMPALDHVSGLHAGERGEPLVGETLLLEIEQFLGAGRQAGGAHFRLDLHELLDLAQEPRLVFRRLGNLLDRETVAERLGDHQDAVGRRPRQRTHDGGLVRCALDFHLIQAGEAGFHRAQRLLQRLLEGAPN